MLVPETRSVEHNMESRKTKLLAVILFTLEAYKASAFQVGQPYSDVVVPIPEVSVTIGGTMQAFPVQEIFHEHVTPRAEIFHEHVTNTQILPYQNIPGYTPTFQQQPQLIILDDACRGNSFDLLLLLLLLGNRAAMSPAVVTCSPLRNCTLKVQVRTEPQTTGRSCRLQATLLASMNLSEIDSERGNIAACMRGA
ncbi:hypothetical protein evm_005210 [Chilo suppressalis]|nr:hypothetical protein evm_005210 [Chilo suppressalis]